MYNTLNQIIESNCTDDNKIEQIECLARDHIRTHYGSGYTAPVNLLAAMFSDAFLRRCAESQDNLILQLH